MKINVQNDYGLYRKKVGSSAVAKTENNTVSSTFKLDTNDISKGSTKVPDKQMLVVKSAVHSHISASADASRLSELRESIQNGTYRIDSDEIAKSILSDI